MNGQNSKQTKTNELGFFLPHKICSEDFPGRIVYNKINLLTFFGVR